MTCSCNEINLIGSVGAVAGGSADLEVIKLVSGGVSISGEAVVNSSLPFDGLESIYLLNEDSTGDIDDYKDLTSHARHGTGGQFSSGSAGNIINTPVQISGLNCSSANYFEDDDWISLPPDNLSSSQAFTISIWVRLDGRYKERTFYTRGSDDLENSYVISLGHTYINHVWAKLKMNDDTVHYCFSSETLSPSKWYHIAVVFDPSTGLKTFINGVLDGTNESAVGETKQINSDSHIGRWNAGGYLNGSMQDLRLHPVARESAYLLAEHDNYCGTFYEVGEIESPILS